MKILLAGNFPCDEKLGSPKILIKLGKELEKRGHFVKYIFSEDLKTALPTKHLRYFNSPLAVFFAVRKYYKLYKGFDIVQIASGDGFIWGLYKRVLKLNNKYICLSIGLEHLDEKVRKENEKLGLLKLSLIHKIGFNVRLRSVELSMKLSDMVICLNSVDKDFIVQHCSIKTEKIKVIPAGVSIKFFLKQKKSYPGKNSLLYVGTWIPRKGVKYLADAYSILANKIDNLSLTIVGGVETEETIKSEFSQNVRNKVQVIPLVPEEELVNIYGNYTIFVFPTLCEGFGMVFLEAMASGLAVITTNAGGAIDIIENNIDGIIVHERDSKAIVSAVEKLTYDNNLLSEIGTRAREKAKNFVWENMAEKIIKIYEK
ncbi:MAG: glycosyltransferase family 4 protein [bacterium]